MGFHLQAKQSRISVLRFLHAQCNISRAGLVKPLYMPFTAISQAVLMYKRSYRLRYQGDKKLLLQDLCMYVGIYYIVYIVCFLTGSILKLGEPAKKGLRLSAYHGCLQHTVHLIKLGRMLPSAPISSTHTPAEEIGPSSPEQIVFVVFQHRILTAF